MSFRIHGFGSPSAEDGDYEDWGFGAPTPPGFPTIPDPQDLGFGDPTEGVGMIPILQEPSTVPDDGGWILNLLGAWPSLGVPAGQAAGPFRVRLLDSGTGQIFPTPAEAFGCYGAFVLPEAGGRAWECYTNAARDRLSFTLPVVPPGSYDVEIAWGLAWGVRITLEDVLTVIYRTPSVEEWAVRSTYPEHWSVGARRPETARLLVAADEVLIRAAFPQGFLEAVTRAVGQEAQLLAGRPVTRLTQDFGPADVVAFVESVLAFPADGARIWLDGSLYSYSSTVGSTVLSGTTGVPEINRRNRTIPRGSLVILDVTSVEADA